MHIVGKKLVFSVNESKKTMVNGEEKNSKKLGCNIYYTRLGASITK